MEENKTIKISVVAPAYNEQDNIENVVRHWESVLECCDYTSEIVITNDGSSDKTLEILHQLAKEFANLRIVNSEANCGYGAALSKAIYASKGEYVVTIDSDGQFELSDHRSLFEVCLENNLDAVTGYRMGKKDTLMRVIADRILNIIVRVLLGLKFKDTNCALKLVKGDMIRKMNIEAKAYPTPTEILIKLKELGANVGEEGVRHNEREGGKSHLKFFKTGMNMLGFLIYMRWKLNLKRRKIIDKI